MAMWAGIAGGVLGMMDDGGGSTTTQNSVPPEFSGLASQVGQMGQQFGNLQYQPYPYAQVAGFNPYQYMGFDMLANQAQNSQLPGQAEQGLTNQIQGVKNPYADAQTQIGTNSLSGAQTSVGTNPYAGSNPFLEQNIQNTLGDMTKQFNMNVAPSMTTNALKSGSFGNTGLQEREDATRSQFAQDLGRTSAGMRMQDYGMQQGLAESDINRRLQAQQGDLLRNTGLNESDITRRMQGQQNDLLRNTGAYESMFGRQMGALGMSPNIYNLGSLPGQQLQGIGTTMQQQGQNVINANYGQFQEAQNWPFKIFDTMRSPFGGINPGGTSTQTGPGGSPVAGALGGAMLGNKIGQGFNWGQPTGRAGIGVPVDQSGNGWW